MKKLLALMLAAALALSLVACGGGSGAGDNKTPSTGNGDTTSTDTPSEEETEITIDDNSIVGTWSGEVEEGTDDSPITISFTIKLYKGGTGKFTSKKSNSTSESNFTSTWELQDNILNLTYGGMTSGYEIEVSDNTMSMTNFEYPDRILYKID